jgi:hypothetical protein
MRRKNPTDDILISYTEGQDDLPGNSRTSPTRDYAASFSVTARIRSGLGPFGPGFALCFGENSSRYFRCTSARWKFNRVDGFTTTADRTSRLGGTSRAHNPVISRSATRRLGERCRERFRIRSCCLTRTDSATTERAPPGPASRAIVVMRWMKSTARSRMTEHRNRSRKPRHAPKLAIRHRHHNGRPFSHSFRRRV